MNGYIDGEDANEAVLLQEALKVAQASEVVVLFLGLPDNIESEGHDRADIHLPDNQTSLLNEISKVNENIIVVLSNGSPVSMPWIDQAKAVLEVWLNGQASGSAIADILFGKVNPSGKLQETFALQVEDNPSYLNFPGEEGKVAYREGIFIGYRYYDKKKMEVLFPFGHGLSYTTFEYSSMRLSGDTILDTDGLVVEVDITNTGKCEGAEIVQLYVKSQKARLIRPEKELKGFEKINLLPGETDTIRYTLNKRDFSYYDCSNKKWVVETGLYEIWIGKSSRNICLKRAVNVISTDALKPSLTGESLVKEWFSWSAAKQALFEVFAQEKMKEQIEAALQGEHSDRVLNMPLRKLFYFDPKRAERAEEIIEKLLVQMN